MSVLPRNLANCQTIKSATNKIKAAGKIVKTETGAPVKYLKSLDLAKMANLFNKYFTQTSTNLNLKIDKEDAVIHF